jgi:hypothetical protein
LQLGHVFGDGIVERDLAGAISRRQQRRVEDFCHRSEIEQHIGRDRSAAVGEPKVQETGVTVCTHRNSDAAGSAEHGTNRIGDNAGKLCVRRAALRRRGQRLSKENLCRPNE